MKRLGKVWTVIVYLFLYMPMIVLFVGSFNDGKDLSEFEGFTLANYASLFRDTGSLALLLNSVILAVSSALLATLIGTFAAVGIHSMRGRIRSLVMTVTNIPLVNPEIVTGVSLSLLFVFVGRGLLHTENVLGFTTLLIAHVTFNLPYVILSVMPKLRQMDSQLMDAAQDLGCTPRRASSRSLLPAALPGIISGAIMAFTMSLDDFVISYFTYCTSFVDAARGDIHQHPQADTAKFYAMFTLMFFVILVVMIIMNIIQASDEDKQKQRVKGV